MKLKFSLLLSAGFNSILAGALIKLCESVGADFTTTDFNSHGWFMVYTWNKEQEEIYTEWLANRIYKDKKQFKYFANRTLKHTKSNCKEVAEEFVFNYGWKIK